uniref:phosphate ABC transporter permease PstA n=1 Tax=Eubacterium sp. TaxID=142586 RepID=UPI00402A5A35
MRKLKEYLNRPLSFVMFLLIIISTVITALTVVFIIGYIFIKGVPNLSLDLFSLKYSSSNQSMLPSIINTVYLTALTLLLSVPIGIFSAIYLAEYSRKNSFFVKIINIANETLSGIPSIVYGLFGFLAFVISKKWGYSLLAGVITLAIMVLPLIIRTSQEAMLGVDNTFREASYGLGAGKLRTVFKIVLPSAMPGILSGIILAIGRIVGETAALIYTAGTVPEAATKLTSSSRTISVHLYCLLNEGLYTKQAYATAVVLIVFVVIINALSNALAKKIMK